VPSQQSSTRGGAKLTFDISSNLAKEVGGEVNMEDNPYLIINVCPPSFCSSLTKHDDDANTLITASERAQQHKRLSRTMPSWQSLGKRAGHELCDTSNYSILVECLAAAAGLDVLGLMNPMDIVSHGLVLFLFVLLV
jgi:hypothetical protein